ncbi:hypothetical protein SARC_11545 [Sphaeroforma arctica JP610]|uniref:Prolyl 4-hydroxylase alpha subunit domain-containing protein n=1 Tax=Sphaeroforma arctica JP610 TaxID=667725 RepID=A0A0L0FGN0_9EUKA|nr:hypothetical protein SARC_11545 [Sphaeroforma arctica JP610]KNC75939.1 hypothetical protein SARC_11545 [Sphaeroforma arctica JP610]|eukprot:XP_014149841.1 hypothetical protein SARC_11545 [Sphaeroforma arctica JP610]
MMRNWAPTSHTLTLQSETEPNQNDELVHLTLNLSLRDPPTSIEAHVTCTQVPADTNKSHEGVRIEAHTAQANESKALDSQFSTSSVFSEDTSTCEGAGACDEINEDIGVVDYTGVKSDLMHTVQVEGCTDTHTLSLRRLLPVKPGDCVYGVEGCANVSGADQNQSYVEQSETEPCASLTTPATNHTNAHTHSSSTAFTIHIDDILPRVSVTHNVIDAEYLNALVEYMEDLPVDRNSVNMSADRMWLESPQLAAQIRDALPQELGITHVMPTLRFIKYNAGGYIASHTDGIRVDGNTGQVSNTSFLLYLTTCEEGGATSFLRSLSERDEILVSVQPRERSILVFPHTIPHLGECVGDELKIMLRGDAVCKHTDTQP